VLIKPRTDGHADAVLGIYESGTEEGTTFETQLPREDQPLDRATAAEYASWFKALADPTRIQIVSLLARRGTPMNVGQIVAAVDVGQSTVSAHLKVLADVRFLLADHRGTATYYRINEACVDCFPTAADIVMGKPAPEPISAESA